MIKPLFVLVDGSSYLYRAYHALPELTSSRGHPTGAMHGVLNMLRRLQADYPSSAFAVVFDPRGPTLRDKWYDAYKANRPPMPDDLARQVEPLHQMIKALGFPLLQVDGVEADDVIGTLAAQAVAGGMEVIISTGDKDFAQLVSADVRLVNTMDNTILDVARVKSKFGVDPEHIVDYLTLIGDSVDNIPGVAKVGPKTAVKWLTAYGGIDGVVANAEQIKGKVGDNLRASLEQIPLSRKLVTIICDVDLGVELADLVVQPTDEVVLRSLFETFDFNTWLKEVPEAPATRPAAARPAPVTCETILEMAHLETWLTRLEQAELFAFDTETTSLDYMQARLVGVSFAVAADHAAYVPLAHTYPGAPDQLDLDEVLQKLGPILESTAHKKVGHNLKYDRNVLLNHGLDLRGIADDTMLESYVFNSTASRHDLDSLALKYLNHQTIHYEDLAGKGAKQIGFNDVAIEEAAPYAAEDAAICLALHEHIQQKLSEQPRVNTLYQEIEMPLVPVLASVERRGVLIDADMLRQQSSEFLQQMRNIEKEALEEAGETFNIGSPKQIQHILFDKLGLPVKSKTPKGQPSTAESTLQDLAHEFALPRLILEYRAVSKLRSTYTDKLPLQINLETGRVHTSYHQAVAATGRLSSSDPNLQNIPIRSSDGRRIRQAFIAPPGRVLLAADYSQIELRIMAHLSGDSGLVGAFDEGLDVHRATAGEVFGAAIDQVSSEQRRAAKAINFGLIYGMSAFGLARQLGIDRGSAAEYISRYFERYPGVRRFMDAIRERAKQTGFVETVFGRRLYLPEINARNAQRRQYAERTAINAPMQGTAADIIKRAMIAVDASFRQHAAPADIIMQVHDELVVEVDESAADDVSAELVSLMSGAAELNVPLVVEVGRGANWDEAH